MKNRRNMKLYGVISEKACLVKGKVHPQITAATSIAKSAIEVLLKVFVKMPKVRPRAYL